jgi:hypothetical protein
MLPSNGTPSDQLQRRWLLSSLVCVKDHVGSVPLALLPSVSATMPTSIPVVDAVLISHDDGDLYEEDIYDDGRDGRLTEVEWQVQSLWRRFLRHPK